MKIIETVEIETTRVIMPSNEMRETLTHEGIEELRESIKTHGLISPITVKRRGNLFEVVAGARRTEAVKSLGLPTIKAQIVEVEGREEEEIKIHENLKREDVDPIEEGEYYKRLVYSHGWNLDEIIKATGRSSNYVEGRITSAGWDENIKSAVKAKAITLGVAAEIMKIKEPDSRARYLAAAANNGVTARTMEAWRLQHEAETEAGAESGNNGGPAGPAVPVHIPATYCAVCGENLKGMITHYVPVSQNCLEVLMESRAAKPGQ